MFELFEHTADLGLRVRAADLGTLLAEAGVGLFSIIVENIDQVRSTSAIPLRIAGDDPVYLLLDWLNELLVTFDTRHVLLARFDVQVGPQDVQATAHGEPLDPARHHLLHEVKAITYHGLKVEQTVGGWKAEVIVDI